MQKYKRTSANYLLVIVLFTSLANSAQNLPTNSLTIEDCYTLAKENYPLVKQYELLKKSQQFTLDNAGKAYLPQISINGQASYQSAVTAIPISIPGISVPELSKDQYKIYAEIIQPLYDGGNVKHQKQMLQANSENELQKLEVELYKLKERINHLYFGMLLLNTQLKQTAILISDLQTSLQKAEASLKNGVLLKSNVQLIQAEILKTNQRVIELKTARLMYAQMLGMLINKTVDENTEVIQPKNSAANSSNNRPELKVLDQQLKNIQIQQKIIKAKSLPKFNLFVQTGYGRPALNMLSNSFDPYYIGGLRLNWNLSGFYTLKNDKALLDINRKNIDLQKELFLFNTDYAAKQYISEINKYKELLSSDNEIVILRTALKKTASAQLDNGVITSADYLREVNAEQQAKESLIIHEIQLLMSQYNELTATGN